MASKQNQKRVNSAGVPTALRYSPAWPLNGPEREFWKSLMGLRAGQQYYFLREEHRRLQLAWSELKVFFNLSVSERSYLLRNYATLTRLYQDALTRMILVGLCSLGEGMRVDGTLERNSKAMSLPTWVARHCIKGQRVSLRIQAALTEYRNTIAPIRKLRNRFLAHSDSRYVLSADRKGMSVVVIKRSFDALEAFFRVIESQYGQPYRADMAPWNHQGIGGLLRLAEMEREVG